MDTREPTSHAALLSALGGSDWVSVVDGIGTAEAWLRAAMPGDRRADDIVLHLVELAGHSKWEVRRAVANAAAQVLHPAFEPVLVRLAADDNSRVRQAAEHASLRRRDWHNASTLGKQHEVRINAMLDDIEVRFGSRGRDAVKRASEEIANTFSRELYHEIIRLLTPLAVAADQLRTKLSETKATRGELTEQAERIGKRVNHLRAVLDGMRAYTAHPVLVFKRESLREVIEESVSLAREGTPGGRLPLITLAVGKDVSADISRSRLVQAITNILQNAIESYEGIGSMKPILVRAASEEGRIVISIEDFGCGMGEEGLRDAPALFATSKPNGTGFGLPLAKKIIESEHLGRLTMESRKGYGTVVNLIIPQQVSRGNP